MNTPTLRGLIVLSALFGLIATGCATAPTHAQDQAAAPAGRQGRQGGGRQMSLAALPVSTLDAIVKLDSEQKSKITAIHDDYVKQAAALRPQAGQRPDDATMQKMRDLNTQATQQIEALLKPEQKTRLEEARKEFGMYRLAGIPLGLYGKIHLTADQKTKIEAIQQTVTASRSNGDRQAMRAAMQTAREQAAGVLTAEQKKQIEDYLAVHPNERRGGGRLPAGGGARA